MRLSHYRHQLPKVYYQSPRVHLRAETQETDGTSRRSAAPVLSPPKLGMSSLEDNEETHEHAAEETVTKTPVNGLTPTLTRRRRCRWMY